MLFEDLYDSVLRRYRVSPPKVAKEGQAVRGRLYESLDAARTEREVEAKKAEEETSKLTHPSE